VLPPIRVLEGEGKGKGEKEEEETRGIVI